MATPFSPSEKRSFLLFLGVFIVVFILLLRGDNSNNYAVCAIIMGLFGFFRLSFLLEYKLKGAPGFLTLPSRLIFGLHHAEDQHKKDIWKRLQSKEVFIFMMCCALYATWLLWCSFSDLSFVKFSEEITIFFEKDVPALPVFSYLNIYIIMDHILFMILAIVIIFLSFSYGEGLSSFKYACGFTLFIFIGLFLWIAVTSDFILSLPPFYTSLIQGIGFGKADIIYQSQPDIFLYPLTGLFKNYLEGGLIGLSLFYTMFGLIFMQFVKSVSSINAVPFRHNLWGGVGLFCLFVMFIVNAVFITPPFIDAFNIMGLMVVGLCWGALLPVNKA